ncbi:MAG: hypothetical protein ACI9W2_002558 [Gammaproteobacteria bacterium]|jgi:hypothetical protein
MSSSSDVASAMMNLSLLALSPVPPTYFVAPPHARVECVVVNDKWSPNTDHLKPLGP